MADVLYIHGMGGGGDSRIPSILNEALASHGVSVHVRTYDFDPETAALQIESEQEVAWTLDGEFGGNHRNVELNNIKEAIDIIVKE